MSFANPKRPNTQRSSHSLQLGRSISKGSKSIVHFVLPQLHTCMTCQVFIKDNLKLIARSDPPFGESYLPLEVCIRSYVFHSFVMKQLLAPSYSNMP